MTTIAYSHKARQIAVDGRITSDSLIESDRYEKWRLVGDEVWFFSGTVSDIERFIAYHKGELIGAPDFQVCCSAFSVKDGACFQLGLTAAGEPWKFSVSYDHAIGSGRDFAITAMDLGMSAKNSVALASTRDTGTGGVISVFDLATMSFVGGDNV